MVGVLELRVAVDPAVDPDEAVLGGARETNCLADRHEWRAGQEAPDAVARPEAQEDARPDGQRGSAERDHELGGHGPE